MGLLQSNATAMNGVASLIGAAASFIPYTKNVTNVSATGISATICPTSGGSPCGKPIVITKFADDKTPIQIDDVTHRETDVSTRGNIIVWNVIPKVRVVLSVIPCTQDDTNLGLLTTMSNEFEVTISQIRQSAPAAPMSAFGIGAAECKKYSIRFYEGTLLQTPPSGTTGQPQGSAESNGRYSGHGYAFLFTKWEMKAEPAEAPGFWSSLGQTIGIG